MNLTFIDDSALRAARFYVLGAVNVGEIPYNQLTGKLIQIKRKFSIPNKMELKWSARGYDTIRLTKSQHYELRKNVLQALSGAEIKLFATALDTHHYHNPTRAADFIYSIERLLERCQYFLRGIKESTIAISDHLSNVREDKAAQVKLAEFHAKGTWWIKLRNIFHTLLYPSWAIPGIQMADFVAGATNLKVNRISDEYFNIIRNEFYANSRGDFKGYGVCFIPKRSGAGIQL